jgi:NAD(P)H-hydrate epimerase
MRTRGASGTPARARRARDGAFLTSDAARRLDEDLTAGRACEARSLEALMRAAGRAAATATLDAFGGTDFVVLCGPGNNGGDGLALAREVATRRRDARVSVWYPKGAGTNELYGELVRECRETANVEFVDEDAVLGMMRERATSAAATPRCFVDALFGFSFKGAVRAPFVNVLNALVALTNGDAGAPDDGDIFVPDLLVSLTAPKQCCATLDDPARGEPRPRVKRMAQTHVVAGTFLTDALCEKYGLEQIPLRVDSDREYVPLDLWRR